ncbi:MAG: AAA family ATPase [Bryobacterales bacterium]|nr:AAA family ATPase [Bryobacterales bacterium]
MDQVTVSDFRCFHRKQTARLAPLTLLVGENSTGKTSFLALIRVLWDVAFFERIPDFKEPPYDLGTFDDIAHFRGGRGGRALSFETGFSISKTPHPIALHREFNHLPAHYGFTFRRAGSGVVPHVRRKGRGNAWAEYRISEDGHVSLEIATSSGGWIFTFSQLSSTERLNLSTEWVSPQRDLPPLSFLLSTAQQFSELEPERLEYADGTSQSPTDEDWKELWDLVRIRPGPVGRPFASAPVRSHPRRTYDPAHAISNPEGEHIPMFLANIARTKSQTWNDLKKSIEKFGRAAGLFDQIAIKVLGGKAGGPFQVQVRKLGTRSKGPLRNIIDVGYGVSQVLPLVTEILRPKGPRMFLLQQPEVHLHPSAQAALGTLFCEMASSRRQLIVETHSDHLIDRVRMDIRDGTTKLKPEDVSILYFERDNLSASIYSLGWDANGNLITKNGPMPEGYRQFFRTERRRSIGL